MPPPALEPLARDVPLPFAAGHPVVAVVAGLQVHVLARDEGRGTVRHAAWRPGAGWEGTTTDVPLASAAGAVAWGADIAVTGARLATGAPAVAVLDADGVCRWVVDVPTPSPLATWPVPTAAGGRLQLAWATVGGTVEVAEVEDGDCRPTASVPVTGTTTMLSAAASGGVVRGLRAGLHPDGVESLDLWPAAGPTTTVTSERAVLVQALAAGPAVVGAWVPGSHHEVRITALPGRVRSIPLPNGRLVGGLLVAGPDGRCALLWRLGVRDGRRLEVSAAVAIVDLAGASLGPILGLGPAPVPYEAGGWLGERLVVVHGRRGAVVSEFRPAEAAGPSSG